MLLISSSHHVETGAQESGAKADALATPTVVSTILRTKHPLPSASIHETVEV